MEQAVATPIEQQINGVDNMDYMYSLNSTNNSQVDPKWSISISRPTPI